MRSLVAAGMLVLAGAVGTQAADPVIDQAPAVADTSFFNNGIYVQLLGGVVQDLPVTYYGPSPDVEEVTKSGFAVAGTLGIIVMDGLSVEADVMQMSRDGDDTGEVFSTTSLMANLKYTVDLNETFSVYGAVGLGYVWGEEVWGITDRYSGAGYQVIAGLNVKLTDTLSGVAEYRFQNTLDESNFDGPGGYGLSIPTSTVLAGIKLSF